MQSGVHFILICLDGTCFHDRSEFLLENNLPFEQTLDGKHI